MLPLLCAQSAGTARSNYAKANRQKTRGISSKESILRVHLVPLIGDKPLNEITTEEVQRLKSALTGWSPKTVNNVLTVLSVALKTAVEWSVIDRVPWSIKLLPRRSQWRRSRTSRISRDSSRLRSRPRPTLLKGASTRQDRRRSALPSSRGSTALSGLRALVPH